MDVQVKARLLVSTVHRVLRVAQLLLLHLCSRNLSIVLKNALSFIRSFIVFASDAFAIGITRNSCLEALTIFLKTLWFFTVATFCMPLLSAFTYEVWSCRRHLLIIVLISQVTTIWYGRLIILNSSQIIVYLCLRLPSSLLIVIILGGCLLQRVGYGCCWLRSWWSTYCLNGNATLAHLGGV